MRATIDDLRYKNAAARNRNELMNMIKWRPKKVELPTPTPTRKFKFLLDNSLMISAIFACVGIVMMFGAILYTAQKNTEQLTAIEQYIIKNDR